MIRTTDGVLPNPIAVLGLDSNGLGYVLALFLLVGSFLE